MKRSFVLPLPLLVCVSMLAAEHPPAPPVAEQTIVVSAGTLAGLPRVKVEAKEHDGPTAAYEGVLLGAILECAGIPRGEKLGLLAVVKITASDGYEVVFTLAETDPIFTDRLIVLADKRDGKPLPEKEGPFRTVAPPRSGPRDGFGTLRQSTSSR